MIHTFKYQNKRMHAVRLEYAFHINISSHVCQVPVASYYVVYTVLTMYVKGHSPHNYGHVSMCVCVCVCLCVLVCGLCEGDWVGEECHI